MRYRTRHGKRFLVVRNGEPCNIRILVCSECGATHVSDGDLPAPVCPRSSERRCEKGAQDDDKEA